MTTATRRMLRSLAAAAVLPFLATACSSAGTSPGGAGGSASPAAAASAPTASAAAFQGRALTADELRRAAVTGTDLPAGYRVAVIGAGGGSDASAAAPGGREKADNPACQPVLDALGPDGSDNHPLAETDLSITGTASGGPGASLFGALLAYPAGRAEGIRAGLGQLLGACTSFTSVDQRGAKVAHVLRREPGPVVGGFSGIGFSLANTSPAGSFEQRAVMVPVGSVLVILSTVGTGAQHAPEPPAAVLTRQVAKVRAAQGGGA